MGSTQEPAPDDLTVEEVPDDDVVLYLTAAASQANDEVLRFLERDGFANLRYADGFIIQHLVPGALPIGELAPKLGVTQQAASKSVADLERRGYVRRVGHPTDGRIRMVELTERGAGAVKAGRRARSAVRFRLEAALGERTYRQLMRQLRAATDELGGVDTLKQRRLRLPDAER